MISPTLLLDLPERLHLERTPQTLILSLRVETSEAVCPLCEQVSQRVHSHYTRTLADLSCADILAPYETYLRSRWTEGERNAVGLFREVTARGYTGSRMTIERFLLGLRRMEQQGMNVGTAATYIELTPRRTVGLMLRDALDLTKEERQALKHACQIHPQVDRLNALFQQFAQMLRERRGEELDHWLHATFHSGIPELRASVKKLRQDQAAVQAGLVLKWNNGMVEGHVNRLKFLKRSMYGRANFDLLRLRVLHYRKCA